jgi:hypothetical protein
LCHWLRKSRLRSDNCRIAMAQFFGGWTINHTRRPGVQLPRSRQLSPPHAAAPESMTSLFAMFVRHEPFGSSHEAPVGHRQPRPQDLPPSVLRDEGGGANSGGVNADRQLDQELQICKGC